MKSFWLKIVELWTSFLVWTGFKKLSFREKLPEGAREEFDKIMDLFKTARPLGPANPPPASARPAPTRANLWIAELEGVDPFLFSEFSPPSMHRVYDEELKLEVIKFSPLFISSHDPIGSSTVAAFAKMLNGRSTNLTIKLVDSLGVIIEVWKFKVKPVSIHPLVMLDYEQSGPIKWQLECETLSWEIQVIDDKNTSDTVN